jgi:site-specific DNA-methyltransferase (adenine-specific)
MSNIKLFKGDCLELMKNIPDRSIDAIITDPPYGTTACKWDSVIPFDLMWEQINRIIKDNGAIVLFGSEPFSSALRMSNIKNYKYDWIWHKNMGGGFATAKKQPLKRHEIISVFYTKQCTYNPQMQSYSESTKKRFKQGEYLNTTKQSLNPTGEILNLKRNEYCVDYLKGTYPTSVKFYKRPNTANGNSLHPTQKPLELMEYLIKTYTNENETVLDFTMGSGTTGVACKNLNRNFIGIEMDDKYFDLAKNRIENYNPQQKLFTV